MKGFIGIVLSNFFPEIGVRLYRYLGRDFKKTCFFWAIFNVVITVIFYVSFYLWKYSENTQDAVNRRNKLLKDAEVKN